MPIADKRDRRAYNKAYYQANREKELARNRARRTAPPRPTFTCRCLVCGYVWQARSEKPERCQGCRSYRWNGERKSSKKKRSAASLGKYVEGMARKDAVAQERKNETEFEKRYRLYHESRRWFCPKAPVNSTGNQAHYFIISDNGKEGVCAYCGEVKRYGEAHSRRARG